MKALPKHCSTYILVNLFVLSFRCFSDPAATPETRKDVRLKVDQEYPSLEALYQHWHAHPELSFHEEQTSAKVAEELKQAGFAVTTKVGGHGVVAVLRNGEGPTILLRADMDALPVKEETDLPYASHVLTKNDKGTEVSVMHACGHDVHMTVLIGAARVLAQLKDRWQGTLVLIGQPAEERVGGAKAMLAAGLFSHFPKPDYCLALHVHARLPAGTVGYVEGFALANTDQMNITIRGVGGHGAWPQTTKDPIVLAAQTVLALQTIVSREITPGEPAVVTVGSVHGGTKHNVIPEEVTLQLTLRSYSDEVRQKTIAAIGRITRGLALAAGLPANRMPVVEFEEESTRATYNDPELTRRLAQVFKAWLGDEKTRREQPVMGGEDFSEYGLTKEKIPICIFWLGSIEPERIRESDGSGTTLPSLHSGRYRPAPEPTIKTGVLAMTAAVFDLAQKK